MKKTKWFAALAAIIALLLFASAAMGESDINNIEITINGVPIEEVIDTASGMFADAVEENMGNAIDGLNAVFDEFAKGFSESLGEIEDVIKNIPFDYFCYSNTGSSTYEIYSYELGREEDTGEWTVVCELLCGNETFTLPVEAELMRDLAAVIDEFDLRRWDGFKGSSNHVLDGSGFNLEVDFTDGSAVCASGDNCFPENFGEAKKAIDELFRAYMEKHGIETEEFF